jgi:UDP-N-acetylglucosamine acyltransferase
MSIHPTAIIDSTCDIASDVIIGPYCIVGPHTKIGSGTILDSHINIHGWTTIGERNRFYSHCSVGTDPQDLKYAGEETFLHIGDDNVFREFITLNRGTREGNGVTVLGDKNLLMAYSHVAHDSIVGNQVIMANAATLAGHVTIGDHATVGAFSAIHQFCKVGPHAFIGGFSVITRDALPYIKTVGVRNQAKIYGINTLGLQRKKFSDQTILELKKIYRIFFRSKLNTSDAMDQARTIKWNTHEVNILIEFIEHSKRGFVR